MTDVHALNELNEYVEYFANNIILHELKDLENEQFMVKFTNTNIKELVNCEVLIKGITINEETSEFLVDYVTDEKYSTKDAEHDVNTKAEIEKSVSSILLFSLSNI